MTQETTQHTSSKTQEARIQALRSAIHLHQSEGIKALEDSMFHTAIHETKECIRLAADIITIRGA